MDKKYFALAFVIAVAITAMGCSGGGLKIDTTVDSDLQTSIDTSSDGTVSTATSGSGTTTSSTTTDTDSDDDTDSE